MCYAVACIYLYIHICVIFLKSSAKSWCHGPYWYRLTRASTYTFASVAGLHWEKHPLLKTTCIIGGPLLQQASRSGGQEGDGQDASVPLSP